MFKGCKIYPTDNPKYKGIVLRIQSKGGYYNLLWLTDSNQWVSKYALKNNEVRLAFKKNPNLVPRSDAERALAVLHGTYK